jgi:hypothetical protein
MSDHDIEELLRGELHAEVAGDRLPDHVFSRAVRRHGRRRAATRVASVTAGAVVVAAGALAVAAPPGHHAPDRIAGHGGTASPRLETVADIRPQLVQALDASHAIIRSSYQNTASASTSGPKPPLAGNGDTATASPSEQTDDNWYDPDTGYNTAYTYDNGQLTSATRYPIPISGTETDINYRTRTWYAEPADKMQVSNSPTGKLGEPRLDTVAGVKAAVQRSDIQIVGHQRMDGRDATHLRFSITPDGEKITGDVWFDSETYVPLRSTMSYGDAITGTTSFLPRTAANVAKTKLPVPDGFRQVTPPSK